MVSALGAGSARMPKQRGVRLVEGYGRAMTPVCRACVSVVSLAR